MKTRKGFAPLILVVVGVIVVGGIIYYDVNRDKTIYEPMVTESDFITEAEIELSVSQNDGVQARENTYDRDTEATVENRDDTTSLRENEITSDNLINHDAVSSNNINITQPKSNKTYKQGSSVDVRWETNNMSGKEMLLGFVNVDGSLACDWQQTVEPYLQNGIPISTPNIFGTSMYIGGPSSPKGVCKLNPGQYKIRLCEFDSSDAMLLIEDTCAFSSSFTVIGTSL